MNFKKLFIRGFSTIHLNNLKSINLYLIVLSVHLVCFKSALYINKDRMVHKYAAQYFLVMSYWLCPTDRIRSKFLSDAKLGTLRNISWNFEPNPSSHYKGVVQKKVWPCPSDKKVQHFWQTDGRNKCKSRDPKK